MMRKLRSKHNKKQRENLSKKTKQEVERQYRKKMSGKIEWQE